jgi:hypothetical protein
LPYPILQALDLGIDGTLKWPLAALAVVFFGQKSSVVTLHFKPPAEALTVIIISRSSAYFVRNFRIGPWRGRGSNCMCSGNGIASSNIENEDIYTQRHRDRTREWH